MQIPASVRAPTWVSKRRLLEQKLLEIHKCTDLNHLKQVHALVYKSNLQSDPFVATKLVVGFSLCRQIALAVNVFSQVVEPNVHLYNAVIKAHIHNSQPSQGFAIFLQMQCCGVSPDNLTYPYLLKACSDESRLNILRMIHAHIEKNGFNSDIIVSNSLIDAYSKCGNTGICSAKQLFGVMDQRDVVSWNSMISGLLKAGDLVEARRLFDEMPERDVVSWNTILDGYVKAREMNVAFELFEKMPSRDVVSWSTMISGYCKAGDMEMARMLFDKMPSKNVVSWTIIITGYAEKGLVKEAIGLYTQLQEAGLSLDAGTFVSILAACAESGTLGLGKRVHRTIERSGFSRNTLVCNALIDMYAKCGSLSKALIVFKRTRKKDLVSWNSMIHGFAAHGHGRKALDLFSRMKREGFVPDKVTFLGLLSACSHAGFVDEGISIFNALQSDYGVSPEVQHYGCLIDLLGRGGRLKDAFALALSMPVEPNIIIWCSLLGACRMHNAVGFAQDVLNHLAEVDTTYSGKISMLSNIYAAAGEWCSAANMRLLMKDIDKQKPSGVSSIELTDKLHEFAVMDSVHPKSDRIYQMIDGLSHHLKLLGSAPAPLCEEH
nr:pentatricopeptide repeat-containing protein At3g29230 [Ipomoea trifida]